MEIYRHKNGGIYRVLRRLDAPYSAKEGDRIPVQHHGRTLFATVKDGLLDQKQKAVLYQCLTTDLYFLRPAAAFDAPSNFTRIV